MFTVRPRFLLILTLVLLPTMSYGKAKAKKKKPLVVEKRTFEQRAIDTSDAVAKRVDRVAESIDLLLAGKKYTKKPNSSSVNVNQVVSHTEGGVLDVSTDFGVNLRLPNLEKRWQLRFTSYDEEEENRDLTQQRVRTRPRPKDYGAALLFFQNLGRIKTTFQPRLELKDPLEMSYVLRFESSASSKTFRIAPRLDLFADPQKGTGEFVSLDISTDLTDRLEISMQNTEEYKERENFFSTQHGLSLDYSLDDWRALGTGVTVGSDNRGRFHLDSVVTSVSYAELLYKERLSYSLTPFVSFYKGQRFKGKAGITLNVSVTL